MNLKIHLKTFVLAATAAAGLSLPALAVPATTTLPAAADATANSPGLLGQTYAGLSYSYRHLDSSPVNADRYGFEYNQPLNTGFDAVFNYDWAQSGLVAGDRARDEQLAAALRAFSTNRSWGKPYVEAGIGYDWQRFGGARDHSFVWTAGAGVEIQATRELTVTPFIRYDRAVSFADNDLVTYGVKGNLWVTRQWAVSLQVDRNDSQDMGFKLGGNFRF